MKVKAVIMRPDRTNDVVIVRKRKMQGKSFRHDDCMYFLNADRFQVTWKRVLIFWKKYYATYYYIQGHPNPLPVPDFEQTEAGFPETIDVGISGEELAAIFNPWFYRVIGSQQLNKWEQIQFYMIVGIAIGLGYLIWKVSSLDIPTTEEIQAIMQAGRAPTGGGSQIG